MLPDEPAGTASTEAAEATVSTDASDSPEAMRIGEPWTYEPPVGVEPQGMFVIVYASETDEAAAEAKRERYQGQYGDAAPTLSVEPSSHYEGLEPGYWVVISAYLDRADAVTDLDWAEQHDIPGYIKPVDKLCDDNIDVGCGS